MRHWIPRRSHLGGLLAAGAFVAALVLPGFTPSPATAGPVACPDMTGSGGVPDGYVDLSDLAAFAGAKGNQSPQGDFNSDGVVDDIDEAMFKDVFGESSFSCNQYWTQQHARAPSCLDMTHDGNVDLSDLAAFAGAKATNDLAGDFSGDNHVTDVDQAILAHHLGSTDVNCGLISATNFDPPPPPPIELNHDEPALVDDNASLPSTPPIPPEPPPAPAPPADPVINATEEVPTLPSAPEVPVAVASSATALSASQPLSTEAMRANASAVQPSATQPAPPSTVTAASDRTDLALAEPQTTPVLTAPAAPPEQITPSTTALAPQPVTKAVPTDNVPLVPVGASLLMIGLGAIGVSRRYLS